MRYHFFRRTRICHNLVVLFLISAAGHLAVGQVKNCSEPVPADIARITAALDLCAQVSHVAGPEMGLPVITQQQPQPGVGKKPRSNESRDGVG